MSFLDIFKTSQFKSEIEQLKQQNQALQEKLNALCYDDYDSAQKTIADLKSKAEQEKSQIAFYEEQKVKVETQFNERKDYFDSEFKKFTIIPIDYIYNYFIFFNLCKRSLWQN